MNLSAFFYRKIPHKREDAKGINSLGTYYEKVLLLNK